MKKSKSKKSKYEKLYLFMIAGLILFPLLSILYGVIFDFSYYYDDGYLCRGPSGIPESCGLGGFVLSLIFVTLFFGIYLGPIGLLVGGIIGWFYCNYHSRIDQRLMKVLVVLAYLLPPLIF